jgi:hypothetical protein
MITLKRFTLALVLLSVVACGKKRFDATPDVVADGNNVAQDAREIILTGDSDIPPIAWSSDRRNVYYHTNERCYTALATSADDPIVNEARQTLHELVNTSVVAQGQRDTAPANSVYLNIRYRDGSTRTFNLNPENTAIDEESLSRGPEIIELFAEFHQQLQNDPKRACDHGK